MTILVTGGAGYIGSHVGLCACWTAAMPSWCWTICRPACAPRSGEGAVFVEGEIARPGAGRRHHRPSRHHGRADHFAGSIVVPDSVADPLAYYGNNVVASRAP